MAVKKPAERETAIVHMWSGMEIDLLRPDPKKILIDDIAMHLSRQPRFGGGTTRTYTVAEHCILGLDFCQSYTHLEFLMHDAPEAYLGDVKGPLKATLGMAAYRKLEERWRLAIAERFGLSRETPNEVHVVDQCMLLTEQRDLKGRNPLSTDLYKPYRMRIPVIEPPAEQLRAEFLLLFYTYAEDMVGVRR